MKNVLARELRYLTRKAAAPLFKIETIRAYAMQTIAAAAFDKCTEHYPELKLKHVDNAKLFANRHDLISSMAFLKGGVVAEIGVADGCFSEFLLSQLEPKQFIAFDVFTMHESITNFDGRTDVFGNMTQLEHYKRKFANRVPQIVIEVGMGQQNLAKYPDKSFDLIYIDGDHSYAGVKEDANLAKAKITDNGVIVFNDYIIFDYANGVNYGVVRAVNELLINEDWRICGFAFCRGMFCDIAVCQPGGPSL